jgi:hypothetical protein
LLKWSLQGEERSQSIVKMFACCRPSISPNQIGC